MSFKWKPATIAEVKDIIKKDLALCEQEQRQEFQKYAVEPFLAQVLRTDNLEDVVVVAKRGDEVIYWEDVEEGFNISPIDGNRILEYGCEQDELQGAIYKLRFPQGERGLQRGLAEPLNG